MQALLCNMYFLGSFGSVSLKVWEGWAVRVTAALWAQEAFCSVLYMECTVVSITLR